MKLLVMEIVMSRDQKYTEARKMTKIFPNLVKIIILPFQEVQLTPPPTHTHTHTHTQTEENYIKDIIIKLLKSSDEKNLKSSWSKKDIIFKNQRLKMTVDLIFRNSVCQERVEQHL